MSLPLSGIRVIELSTMVTASMAAMMLSDQGAEVIKIEPPDIGDPMRYLGQSKGGIAALFANCNRGKRALAIDIRNAAGREVVLDLVERADVLVHNFRPGVMDRLGLSFAAMRARNSKLIHASVSGFGEQGELANAPAYDHIVQASTGFTGVQGMTQPEFMRTLACDKITAYTVSQAILTALFKRERTGEPSRIHVSMRDASLFFLFPDGMMSHTLLDDDIAPAMHMRDTYGALPTANGFVAASAATDKQWQGFMRALGFADVLNDPRASNPAGRGQIAMEMRPRVLATLAQLPTSEVLRRLGEQDVPAAACRDIGEAIQHAQDDPFGPVRIDQHPRMGALRRLLPPALFDDQRAEESRACPALGEHTRDILTELGRTSTQLDQWLKDGTIKA